MQGKPEVTRPAIIQPTRRVQDVPKLTEWRQQTKKTSDTQSDKPNSAGLVLDGSILWPTPGVSGLDGLRLLDPEDSIFYNPARAVEELGQIGHTNPTSSEATGGA
jgi:hypothetical protein